MSLNSTITKAAVNAPPSPPDTECSFPRSSVPEFVQFPLPPPSTIPSILEVDKKTPDAHVPRDPRLIRLTGTHPFNVEAPLSALFSEGFLTSPELFYVRNHGAVPHVPDVDIFTWEFSVEGLVENPFTLSLLELMTDYDQVTYPVTLVCAGNRRKEQNVVRKSKGFSWGPAGLSTALFTGVAMADVIRRSVPTRSARYVCMEGADRLPNGYYGTSVKLNWVTDPNRGIMLAYKMNGEMLRPDHGKPLRAVIPGQIGGRSVKWLKRLIITDVPSDNWYHIYDNLVLPTQITPEDSVNKQEVWKDERYAIYGLSCNSAIAYPAHDEVLKGLDSLATYAFRGYAYGGGGRRITRVELSLNRGSTWVLANIDYAEDRYREASAIDLFGGRLDMGWRETSFCWCFWDLDISIADLSRADDIVVRCMDDSMTIQPRDMYWSVLGMMNNPWFRVCIHKEGDSFRFEHPTQPALMPGGWMERVKKAGGNLGNGYWGERIGRDNFDPAIRQPTQEITMTKANLESIITIDDFRKHEMAHEPWFALNGEVYDGTAFLQQHPGGAQSIVSAAGTDVTEEFMAIHSETAKAMMVDYHIGTLDAAAKTALEEGCKSVETSNTPRSVFLDTRAWSKATLHSKDDVSSDTKIFRFKLDHEEQKLGLPTGMHLMIRLRDPVTRELIIRSYTPISSEMRRGIVDVLVKIYFDTEERKGGKMTQALDALPIGQAVEFKGPTGKFEYLGRGVCHVKGAERRIQKFIMICGGSGITPIYQVFRAVMQDPEDHTTCLVINSNRTVDDILCGAELDALMARNTQKGRVINTLTQPPEGWTGLHGRIAAPLLLEHCHCADNTMIMICGPESMEQVVRLALVEQGWSEENLLFF